MFMYLHVILSHVQPFDSLYYTKCSLNGQDGPKHVGDVYRGQSDNPSNSVIDGFNVRDCQR